VQTVRNIHRHVLEQEKLHPEASGTFTTLLYQIALGAKIIGHHVNKAGLLDVLGGTGEQNVLGDSVQKLDVFANSVMKDVLLGSGTVCAAVSEEEEALLTVPPGTPQGPYIVHFDPLDGSSNIDANVSIGTIFGIYKKQSPGETVTESDILQPGKNLVAAGYVVYGSSTMMVYSAGNGVHGFTYDPSYGEFILSHPDIRIPDGCRVYSVNEVNSLVWKPGCKAFINGIKTRSIPRYKDTTGRHIGSLVADFHRNLLYGGVYLYPENKVNPEGKLRLLYEAAPLGYIAEQAGGAASSGKIRIRDMVPTVLHERVPFVVGNTYEVESYEALWTEGYDD